MRFNGITREEILRHLYKCRWLASFFRFSRDQFARVAVGA